MRRSYSYRWLVLAAVCAVGLRAETAFASGAVQSLNQAAALLTTPWLATGDAGGGVQTLTTLTNTGTSDIIAHIEVVDRECRSVDHPCALTGNETTEIYFRPNPNGTGTLVSFRCAEVPTGLLPPAEVREQHIVIGESEGFLVVTVEDPAGSGTLSSNVLFADWTFVDFGLATAYGTEAITFQGVSALAQDGDRSFTFDGKEYATFPAQLASNFFAEDDNRVTGDLILLTLDFTENGSLNPVRVAGNIYDDKESPNSYAYNFDCYTRVPFDVFSPALVRQNLSSDIGHFDLSPQIAAAGDPGHETEFGTGGNSRIRPVTGWIVQSIRTGGQLPFDPGLLPSPQVGPPFPTGAPTVTGVGSWARPLGTSVASFVPLSGDTPALKELP